MRYRNKKHLATSILLMISACTTIVLATCILIIQKTKMNMNRGRFFDLLLIIGIIGSILGTFLPVTQASAHLINGESSREKQLQQNLQNYAGYEGDQGGYTAISTRFTTICTLNMDSSAAQEISLSNKTYGIINGANDATGARIAISGSNGIYMLTMVVNDLSWNPLLRLQLPLSGCNDVIDASIQSTATSIHLHAIDHTVNGQVIIDKTVSNENLASQGWDMAFWGVSSAFYPVSSFSFANFAECQTVSRAQSYTLATISPLLADTMANPDTNQVVAIAGAIDQNRSMFEVRWVSMGE